MFFYDYKSMKFDYEIERLPTKREIVLMVLLFASFFVVGVIRVGFFETLYLIPLIVICAVIPLVFVLFCKSGLKDPFVRLLLFFKCLF